MADRPWLDCSGNPFLAASPATRTGMTPSGCVTIRQMRRIVGGKAAHSCAASPSQTVLFEIKWLSAKRNRLHARRPPKGILLDMVSSVSPTHGARENSVWNGHYHKKRRERHHLWSPCRLSAGRGRHSAEFVRRHLAADCGTAAARSHRQRVAILSCAGSNSQGMCDLIDAKSAHLGIRPRNLGREPAMCTAKGERYRQKGSKF